MTNFNINFSFTFNELRNKWVVYELRCKNTGIVDYIGYNQLHRLFSFGDVLSNPLVDDKHPYICTVTDIVDSKNEAVQMRSFRCMSNGEVPRAMKYRSLASRSPFICHETGETFQTIQECVYRHGVGYGALCNHLNRKPGFKTVKGRTYSRNIPAQIQNNN